MLRDQSRKIDNRSARSRKSAKPWVIFNPNAGSIGDIDAVIAQLNRLDPAVIRMTRKARDAQRFAREALRNNYEWIITAGGDGTLNEVVNGVASCAGRVCLGLMPLGTGNDFARSLNLPTAVEDNIDILLSKKTKPIDIVRVRSSRPSRYFVNVSAGGFSEVVDEQLTPDMKQTWGPLAYLRSAAAALPKLHVYHAHIEFDSSEVVRVDLYNIVVANGRFVAGGLPIAPNADPGDGLLDIVLIPTHPAAKVALLAAEILLGKHFKSNAVEFRRAKKIAVRSRPAMWFNVDGEPVGTVPAVFEVVPRALNFVVPE
ncbi:MAG TPA: diacylglycerol kinase family protein [Chthoniobacterales bacterium]|nr:diacylglycerol kinase family protein [Chthoniobacterales bacterium]